MIEPEKHIHSVTEITNRVRDALESTFPLLWIEGEISTFRVPSSGHMYFILKDDSSQLRVVMFRGNNRFLKFTPTDGQKILIRGRITVYSARGEYQLIADIIEPRGIGELQLAYEQLKDRLAQEGLFDASAKKSLPQFPSTVGIITSPTGAAIQDMIRILFRRFPGLKILFYPVKVQGTGAAEDIAEGIRVMNHDGRSEVIIIGRGGGSIEDLWAFNEEIVARAIFESAKPIVSAVGHEIDFTIADFAADLRAPTPSAAAELVVPDKLELQNSINHLFSRCLNAIQRSIIQNSLQMGILMKEKGFFMAEQQILEHRQRVDELNCSCVNLVSKLVEDGRNQNKLTGRSLAILTPERALQQKKQLLVTTVDSFDKSMTYSLEMWAARFDRLRSNLSTLSPLNILERGYSVVRKTPDKILVKRINQLAINDRVEILLSDGVAQCQVTDIYTDGKK